MEALVAEVRRAGIALAVAGDRLRVKAPAGALTPELREHLATRKPELLEVLWRLDGMRQYPDPIPTAKGPQVCGGPGHCFSCGDLHDHPEAYGRCEWCWRAAELFYADRPAGDGPAGSF